MGTNYIVIGDSITYGIGDFESGGWATMFKKYIINKDDSKVCNNYFCFYNDNIRMVSICKNFKHTFKYACCSLGYGILHRR